MQLGEPATRGWDFPRAAAGVAHLTSYGAARGLPVARALAGTGLVADDLRVAGLPVTAAQELAVVRTLQRHLGQGPGGGDDLGRSYRLASFGAFGWALLASPTLVDAVNVALRYLDLSFTFALPRADVIGEEVQVSVDGATLPADVREFLVRRDLAAIHSVLEELVPGELGGRCESGADSGLLRFPGERLERQLSRSDPRLAALAADLCEEVVTWRRARTGLAQEVRVHVLQRLPDGAPLAAVSHALGLSERTLRRRLAAAGTSYRALVDEVREPVAAELLGAGLPVAAVAQRLGYAGSTSFIHAHRRWTGRTPGAVAH